MSSERDRRLSKEEKEALDKAHKKFSETQDEIRKEIERDEQRDHPELN